MSHCLADNKKNMNSHIRFTGRGRITIMLLFLAVAVIAQIIRFTLLPDKFFIDSNMILNGMQYPGILTGAFRSTANVFQSINFFNATTLVEWAVLLAIPYNLYFSFYFAYRFQSDGMTRVLYVLFTSAVLNIYVFQLSKESIQLFFFLLLNAIIRNRYWGSNAKVLLCSSLLILIGLIFRTYYIIIACYTLMAYCVSFLKIGPCAKKNSVLTCALLITGVLVSLVIVRFLLYEQYLEIIFMRNRLTLSRIGNENAQTLILNWIPYYTDHLILFLANYVLNLLRMLLPLELLLQGVYYSPFVVFQFLISRQMFLVARKARRGSREYFALIVMTGYFLGSALFEPDFGSYLRHLAAATPVIVLLFDLATAPHTAKSISGC